MSARFVDFRILLTPKYYFNFLIRDDAHVTPSSSEIHKPMHVVSTLPLVNYDHVSTPEWVLHFQKTFREHEQRFAQMDILVDQITYLRTKLEQTQAELEASNARYEELLAKSSFYQNEY
ncbi:hypothetical protein BDB01DRAFT_839263 [Pilobolus umbonatus]|nr:hypothetical protein BDB01DRAFT_839263 [Pilobolus umbonatus]